MPAEQQDQHDGQRVDHFHHGPHEAVDGHLRHGGFAVLQVEVVQLVVLFLFPAKRLDHADARKAFGDEAVDAGNERLHLHKIAVQRPRHKNVMIRISGTAVKAISASRPVHVEHHHDDADQQENVPEQADEHVVVEFVERLHVVGGAG